MKNASNTLFVTLHLTLTTKLMGPIPKRWEQRILVNHKVSVGEIVLERVLLIFFMVDN